MVESVHVRLWVQSADCKVNFQCAWIRGHLHRCQPPLTPPLFQGQLYFEITHKDWHLMKTHSIIQRCQVYFVTLWCCFPLSCPFSTFLFQPVFLSIPYFSSSCPSSLSCPFLSLFLPSSSLYKVLKPVLILLLILNFNLDLIFSGTAKYRHILFYCTFLLYFAGVTFLTTNLVVRGKSMSGKSTGTIFPTFAHFVPLSHFGNSCNISNSFIIIFVVLIYYQLNLMLLLQRKL